jgi:hypothetical protein
MFFLFDHRHRVFMRKITKIYIYLKICVFHFKSSKLVHLAAASLADKTAMEAEAEQARWVSVTYASMTASEEGAGGAVWQWLKPEVVSNKAAPGGGTTRAQELEPASAWRSTRRDGAGVKGTPPSARMAHTASALGASRSEVLVFGGLSDTQKPLRDAFLLNTSTPMHLFIYLFI